MGPLWRCGNGMGPFGGVGMGWGPCGGVAMRWALRWCGNEMGPKGPVVVWQYGMGQVEEEDWSCGGSGGQLLRIEGAHMGNDDDWTGVR
ncbi:hypothetical protein Pcinc_021384 [Petrolisthes cinctipes]|uniref:Uncharacterized protein n=1 Tax=Petrolisthes cinctipes TaxID=88211 RepID=A0AAE1FI20_PETCI|nr:hypothetical protein Pcinc_021384 [Petrolisthes cinctipes]